MSSATSPCSMLLQFSSAASFKTDGGIVCRSGHQECAVHTPDSSSVGRKNLQLGNLRALAAPGQLCHKATFATSEPMRWSRPGLGPGEWAGRADKERTCVQAAGVCRQGQRPLPRQLSTRTKAEPKRCEPRTRVSWKSTVTSSFGSRLSNLHKIKTEGRDRDAHSASIRCPRALHNRHT